MPNNFDELAAEFRPYLYLPDDGPLAATLAAYLVGQGSDEPIWILMVGPPSSGKSEILRSAEGMPGVHAASDISRAGLFSGMTGGSGGLITQISRQPNGRGTILFSDMTTIFSRGSEARSDVFGLFSEMFDGHVVKVSGAGGGLIRDVSFTITVLAGTTEVADGPEISAELASLGQRFLTVRMQPLSPPERLVMAAMERDRLLGGTALKAHLARSVREFLSGRQYVPIRLDGEAGDRAGALACFVTGARTPCPRDRFDEVVAQFHPEGPARLQGQLRRLHGGLVAIDYAEPEPLVRRIACDSIPPIRWKILRKLLSTSGSVPTSVLADSLGLEASLVGRASADLATVGVLEVERMAGNERSWSIVDDYRDLAEAAGILEPEASLRAGHCSFGVKGHEVPT